MVRAQLNSQTLIRVCVILAAAAFVISMALHQMLGHARNLVPFLSEADHFEPEGVVFTTGLVGFGILLIPTAIMVMHKRQHEVWKSKPATFNHLVFLGAIFIPVSTVWMATHPWNDYPLNHSFSAVGAMGGAVLWCYLLLKYDRFYWEGGEGGFLNIAWRTRFLLLAVGGMVMAIVGCTMAEISHPGIMTNPGSWVEGDSYRAELLLIIGALGEWILVVGLLVSLWLVD